MQAHNLPSYTKCTTPNTGKSPHTHSQRVLVTSPLSLYSTRWLKLTPSLLPRRARVNKSTVIQFQHREVMYLGVCVSVYVSHVGPYTKRCRLVVPYNTFQHKHHPILDSATSTPEHPPIQNTFIADIAVCVV